MLEVTGQVLYLWLMDLFSERVNRYYPLIPSAYAPIFRHPKISIIGASTS